MNPDMRGRILTEVDSLRDRIIEIVDYLYAHPELGHQEHKAAQLLTSELGESGFKVQKGIHGMETAFKAEFAGKEPGPKVALLAEYDALGPPVGHGCQHNLIAAMSIGAGIAMCRLMPELKGTLYVYGCPAEEGIVDNAGGKVIMVDEFKDKEVAMMIHGSTVTGDGTQGISFLNREALEFTFLGHATSAANAESASEGVNALEACMLFWNALNAYRPHIKDGARVYGIITEGGTAVNVIPDRAVTRLLIRAPTYSYFLELVEKVKKIAEGAAMTLDAQVRTRVTSNRYLSYIPNQTLAQAFGRNIESLGLTLEERVGGIGAASDIGNVSHVCPSLHAFIASMPKGTPDHSVAAAEASVSELGHNMAIMGAKALCLTALDIFTGAVDVKRIRQEFEEAKAQN